MKIIPMVRSMLILWLSGLIFINCQPKQVKSPFLTGRGTGIDGATLMVNDLEAAITYFEDTLGFNIRGSGDEGPFAGSITASINLGDMTTFELMSMADSLEENKKSEFMQSFLDSNEGVRLYSLSTSSTDSTLLGLTSIGHQLDSIQSYRTSSETPEGWSWDDGSPKRRSLDFNATDPPAFLPRFIEKIDYGYADVQKDWRTYYIYRRWFNDHPNGVVGTSAIRIAVADLIKAHKTYQEMGLELIEKSDSIIRFQVFRHQELHLVSAKNNPQLTAFVTSRGEGVFAVRFDVTNLDSTYQYLEKELPSEAISRTAEHVIIQPEHAFGVQLEFVQEPDSQSQLAKRLTPEDELDSLALQHASGLYDKYCSLCHGSDREGYAADHAPSLRSKSLLASSKETNFMRYTMQYGRANTAMAGYLNTQGGPMEYIEIELLLEWLYQVSEVDESVEIPRDPVLGDVALGAELYSKNCSVCHGANGEGISAPALGNPMLLATATDHFLRYAIAQGRDGTPMIGFKDSLNAKEIDGLTAFLRSRASGWDIPESDTVSVPSPEEYVLNPDAEDPVFELKDGKYVAAEQVNRAYQDSLRMIILDARSEVAWRQTHIPGAIPVPYYEDPENFIDDIPNDGTQIVIYCACPHAASNRVRNTLKRNGFENAVIIDEGILVWAQMGYPVRNGS
ncbi:MAG: c-type cytochrome [Cytophagales bacterium]|nr:c-type cytochrome [Cytophagales bacterium]